MHEYASLDETRAVTEGAGYGLEDCRFIWVKADRDGHVNPVQADIFREDLIEARRARPSAIILDVSQVKSFESLLVTFITDFQRLQILQKSKIFFLDPSFEFAEQLERDYPNRSDLRGAFVFSDPEG